MAHLVMRLLALGSSKGLIIFTSDDRVLTLLELSDCLVVFEVLKLELPFELSGLALDFFLGLIGDL